MPNYKLLMFDLDDTLINYAQTEQEALVVVHHVFFSNICILKALIKEFKVINANLWLQYRAGNLDLHHLRVRRFNELCQKFNASIPAKKITETYEQVLGENVYLFKDTMPFLEWAQRHYTLSLVSNGLAAIQRKKLSTSGLDRFFPLPSLSEEIGYQKPMKEIFYHSLQNTGYKAEEALMTGDSLDSDLLGAANSNIDFCWMNRQHRSLGSKYPDPKYKVATFDELKEIVISQQES